MHVRYRTLRNYKIASTRFSVELPFAKFEPFGRSKTKASEEIFLLGGFA